MADRPTICFVGPRGSGKTTLIARLAGEHYFWDALPTLQPRATNATLDRLGGPVTLLDFPGAAALPDSAALDGAAVVVVCYRAPADAPVAAALLEALGGRRCRAACAAVGGTAVAPEVRAVCPRAFAVGADVRALRGRLFAALRMAPPSKRYVRAAAPARPPPRGPPLLAHALPALVLALFALFVVDVATGGRIPWAQALEFGTREGRRCRLCV